MTETVTPRRVRMLSGALDQFFSSVSNGFIIFAMGVVATPDEFGYVSILMMSLLAVMVCLRGGLGLPLLHKADQSADVVRREGSLALTTALIASVLVVIPALILLPKVGMAAVAIAVSAPFVLSQDVCRYVLMAIGRPQIAALWDGAWFVGTLLVLVGSWLDLRFITTSSVLAAWGFFGAVAFVGMAIHLRLVPSARNFVERLKPGFRDRVNYAASNGLEQIGSLLALSLVATILSPAATGALRGAIALLAPIGIFGSAVSIVLIPESVRSSAPPQRVWRVLTRLGVFTALMTSAIGLVFYMLPPSIGFYLLGETFVSSQEILPPVTAQFVAACLAVVLGMYVRIFNRSAAAFWLRTSYVIAMLTAAIVSALWFGSAMGVASGIALAAAVAALGGLVVLTPWKEGAAAATKVDELVIDGPGIDEPPMNVEPVTAEDLAEAHESSAAPARKGGMDTLLTLTIIAVLAVNVILVVLYLVLRVF